MALILKSWIGECGGHYAFASSCLDVRFDAFAWQEECHCEFVSVTLFGVQCYVRIGDIDISSQN